MLEPPVFLVCSSTKDPYSLFKFLIIIVFFAFYSIPYMAKQSRESFVVGMEKNVHGKASVLLAVATSFNIECPLLVTYSL